MSDEARGIPEAVWGAFDLASSRATPITIGLINRTFRVDRVAQPPLALQRLHPIFAPEVNLDLDALTRVLDARGVPTPRLHRTIDGAAWVSHEGHTWRALTWLEGRTLSEVPHPDVARAAGALAGRFHAALADVEHTFAFGRAGVHDTPAHLAGLAAAAAHAEGDATHAESLPLAAAVLAHAEALPSLPASRPRLCHGDLKITNLLFHPQRDEGLALVDLDTMTYAPLAVELGDALRSWCNPAGESARGAFDAERFEAALAGWAETGPQADPDERASLVLGVETIATELAARFARDAFEDRYFGWDSNRYASRIAHNRARAASQLALARSIRAQRRDLERRAARALAPR